VTRIFLSPPEVGAEERRMLLEAFDSNWIAPVGPDLDAFEREVAEQAGVAHGVALSSGTAALHLALLLAGVESGDEVLVPSFTFIASASAVTYIGARPVFVDCSPISWNLDPALVEEALTKRAAIGQRPAAVVTVDLYGETADYLELESICRSFEIPLIEDSAEALGSTYRGRAAGSFGAAGIFSFNGNKIITTSGGGMLVTSSQLWAERARHLATQAREPFSHYEHLEVGYNYRLSNLLAALGRAQLQGLSSRIGRREGIDATYREGLADLPGLSFMPRTSTGTSNHWLTCILIDPEAFGSDRERVRLALEEADIESRPVWKPLHLQPAFAGFDLIGAGYCARIFDRGLCLPTGSALSPGDQGRIMAILKAQLRG
jgi:dTDP-4-amino-4,6-dideoxygalactose transaminase